MLTFALILGTIAWFGSEAIKNTVTKSGVRFGAFSLAFLVVAMTPLAPGVNRYNFWFFMILALALGHGAHFFYSLIKGK